jgi:hypothetical protein
MVRPIDFERGKIMRTATILTGVALATLAVPAGAADKMAVGVTSEAQIQGDGAAFRAHLVNRSFAIARFATSGPSRELRTLLLNQTNDRTLIGEELDRESGRISVMAQPIDDGAIGDVAYRFSAPGDEGYVTGPYYVITRYGCCVTGTAYTVFSLETGKLLLRHSDSAGGQRWLTLLLKGRETLAQRVAVAYMAMNAADRDELGDDKSRVLSLTYAQQSGALQRLYLRLPAGLDRDAALDWTPALSWISDDAPAGIDHLVLTGTGAPETAARNIALRVRLDDDVEFTLKLDGDRFDLASASLPAGFALEEAPLP